MLFEKLTFFFAFSNFNGLIRFWCKLQAFLVFIIAVNVSFNILALICWIETIYIYNYVLCLYIYAKTRHKSNSQPMFVVSYNVINIVVLSKRKNYCSKLHSKFTLYVYLSSTKILSCSYKNYFKHHIVNIIFLH